MPGSDLFVIDYCREVDSDECLGQLERANLKGRAEPGELTWQAFGGRAFSFDEAVPSRSSRCRSARRGGGNGCSSLQ